MIPFWKVLVTHSSPSRSNYRQNLGGLNAYLIFGSPPSNCCPLVHILASCHLPARDRRPASVDGCHRHGPHRRAQETPAPQPASLGLKGYHIKGEQ